MTEISNSAAGRQTTTTIKALRIIVIALAAGVMVFMTAGLALRGVAAPPAGEGGTDIGSLLAYMALAICVVQLPAIALIRKRMSSQLAADRARHLETIAAGQVPGTLTARTIITAALIEGPALFACVTLLIGGPVWVTVIPALAIPAILALLPTATTLEEAVERAR